jgi:hypothetical protein
VTAGSELQVCELQGWKLNIMGKRNIVFISVLEEYFLFLYETVFAIYLIRCIYLSDEVKIKIKFCTKRLEIAEKM